MTTRSETADPSAASGLNYVWIGGLTGNWQDPANWSLGAGIPASVSPGPDDNATISTAANLAQEIDGTGSVASLALDGSSLINGQIAAQSLQTSGILSLASGTTLSATSAILGSETINYLNYDASREAVDVNGATLVVGDASINATSFQVGSGGQVRFNTVNVASPTAFNIDDTSSIEIGSASLSTGLLPATGAVTIDPGATFTMPGYFATTFPFLGYSASIENLIDNGSLSIAVPPINPREILTKLSIGALSGTGDFDIGSSVHVNGILPGTLHIEAAVQPVDFRFANLDVNGIIAAGNVIDFSNALEMSIEADFNGDYNHIYGTITNFNFTSEIRIVGTNLTSITYTPGPGDVGTLSVLSGGETLGQFAIAGNYANDYFVMTNEGPDTAISLSPYSFVNGVLEIPTSPDAAVSLSSAELYLLEAPVQVDVSGSGVLIADNTNPLNVLQIDTGATVILQRPATDFSDFTFDSVQIASGATLQAATSGQTLAGAITGSGSIATSADAPIILDGAVSSGITLNIQAAAGGGADLPVVVIELPGTFDATIAGFNAGQVIQLTGSFYTVLTSQITTVASTEVTLTDLGQVIGSFHFAGDYTGDIFSTDQNGLLTEAPCYCGGTRILTPDGEIPVEMLHVGDIVTTADQGPRQIRWIGQRSIDLSRKNGRTPDLHPVRIRAGAFADGMPHRDLLVTPEHCILVGKYLVPARLLINGGSILFDTSMTRYEVFHIELERHAILVAEGLQAESYLDTGNRDNFGNAFLSKLWPDFAIPSGHKAWTTDAAAPLMVDPVVLEPVWHGLAARAVEQGHTPPPLPATTREAELHLLLPDGQLLSPERVLSDGRYCFLLHHQPISPRQVQLVSRQAAAADLRPWLDDRRQLGVAVSRIRLWTRDCGLNPTELALQDPALARGWWPRETTRCDTGTNAAEGWRWTDGDALLALPRHCMRIEVTIQATSEYIMPGYRIIARSA